MGKEGSNSVSKEKLRLKKKTICRLIVAQMGNGDCRTSRGQEVVCAS